MEALDAKKYADENSARLEEEKAAAAVRIARKNARKAEQGDAYQSSEEEKPAPIEVVPAAPVEGEEGEAPPDSMEIKIEKY